MEKSLVKNLEVSPPNYLKRLAPRAGLEPATIRLTVEHYDSPTSGGVRCGSADRTAIWFNSAAYILFNKFIGFDGGRTRTRTLDPLIRRQSVTRHRRRLGRATRSCGRNDLTTTAAHPGGLPPRLRRRGLNGVEFFIADDHADCRNCDGSMDGRAKASCELAAWIAKWGMRYPRLVGWVEEIIEEKALIFSQRTRAQLPRFD
jgi:hypothetical protein